MDKKNILNALEHLDKSLTGSEKMDPILFDEFLEIVVKNPSHSFRNIIQVFYEMFSEYISGKEDEYPDDPESIQYINYDCAELFVKNSDQPFFADRIFANQLVNRIEALRRGAQQNKIYIFEGPPGCGKSTFLNNLLLKFEEYCKLKKRGD